MVKEVNLKTGQLGEEIARKYLKKKGYKILEQNAKNKFGEIDIVAKDKKELVFVEVRTKIGDTYGSPEDSLTKNKLRRLRQNAIGYVNKNNWKGDYRIDAVCIVLAHGEDKPEKIEHHLNIE
jgi:putative endonuclease